MIDIKKQIEQVENLIKQSTNTKKINAWKNVLKELSKKLNKKKNEK